MEERRLIGEDGRPNFGIFSKPLNIINIDDLRPYGERDCPSFKKGMLKMFKIKRWQYMGVTNSKLVFGSAIVSTGYLGNVFLYIFDRAGKELFEVSFVKPFASGILFEGSPEEGKVIFSGGKTSLSFENTAENITLSLRHKEILSAELRFRRLNQPLSVIVRESLAGFNYTNKEAGMETEGEITLNQKKYHLNAQDSFGVLDYTICQLSRETFWNWASGGGILKNGDRIGFNLSAGVNETGITENVVWINNKMHRFETIKFGYSDLNMMEGWRILSNDKRLDFSFMPEGMRKADINALFIRSRFFQPFGRFEGYIDTGNNRTGLKEVYGFTEEHFAKW